MKYEVPKAGGVFEHRGADCATHGTNVPHARVYGACGRYECVQCLLSAQRVSEEERRRQVFAASPLASLFGLIS